MSEIAPYDSSWDEGNEDLWNQNMRSGKDEIGSGGCIITLCFRFR
jgi:hypothetical protein